MRARMYPFTWAPGWSFSRMRTLRTCARQYWYRYYGKRFIDPSLRPLLEDLTRLTTIHIEAGNAVHETIAGIIRRLADEDVEVDESTALAMAEERFLRYVRDRPLFEERYGDGVTDDDRSSALARVRTAIHAFYATRWPGLLRETPTDMRAEWIIDPPGYGEFRFEGRKVYAKPDLIFRDASGAWYVVDWKTGRPDDEDPLQVQAYMFFAHEVFGIPLDSSTGVVEYLSDPDVKPVMIRGTEVDQEALRERILDDMATIEELCEDVERNLPRPIDSFPRNVSERTCLRCNYRELCRPELGGRFRQQTLDIVLEGS